VGENPDTYTLQSVERLLGYYEPWSSQGERNVTILDLLSWARDPGGMHLHREDEIDWTWRRGPLAPHSDDASTLWDFFIAIKRLRMRKAPPKLSLQEHAVLALTICGFTENEIARVLGWPNQQRVSRVLVGRPKRDGQGQEVRDEHGAVIYVGGIARKVTRAMNGELD
jgi:hypothetical protein